MIKKILASSIICILLLFASISAKAATFTDNQVVDANKSWTIHFNQEVELDNLTKHGISVTDSKGNAVNVTFTLGSDNKSVVVNAPTGGYIASEKYKLVIGNKVHSTKSKCIKQIITLNFIIKNDTKESLITFKDKNLEQAVRDAINKPAGNLLKSDAEKITKLDIDDNNVTDDKKITDISGIEKLTNLQEFDLYNDNQLVNIDALKGQGKRMNIYLPLFPRIKYLETRINTSYF